MSNRMRSLHMQRLPCPASHFQCKNYNRIGHFTSRCLTKSKTINQIDFQEEINSLNAWQAQGDADTFYICQIQEQQQAQQRTPKGSASTSMLTCHSQPGTTTKMDLPSCPYQPRYRCQSYACVSVQVPNWGQKTPTSGTCAMHYDSVHKQNNPKPWKYPSVCEIPWQTHTEVYLQCDKPRR